MVVELAATPVQRAALAMCGQIASQGPRPVENEDQKDRFSGQLVATLIFGVRCFSTRYRPWYFQ